MQITLQTSTEPTDTLIIPVIQSDTLADLAERVGLETSVFQRDFKAEPKEVLVTYGPEGQKTVLLGLGKEPALPDWIKAFREYFFRNKAKLSAQVSIDLTGFGSEVVEAVVLGVRWGGYDLRLYQTNKTDVSDFYGENGRLTLIVSDPAVQSAVEKADVIASTHREILDLMNAPANYVFPQTLADWATASGRKYGYSVQVFDENEIENKGLLALLSVSRGSEKPPRFIVAEYVPEGVENPKTVGLVGKGVTFDTGGVSIKQSTNMHLMKSDMGGAAAVLGTLEAAARLALPIRLIGIIPTTENSTDGKSTKPGDVVGSYLGKTIEIIDTDAEGRVILADGLGYLVRNYQPDVIIDLATLTGNCIAALGYQAAGLFTNNDRLAADLSAAADHTGERVWRLPLWDAYKEDLKSDVADVKNFHGKPFTGAINGAKFLEVFTESHPAWAHLDIAGVAFGDTEFGTQKNATGYGIRLLIEYLEKLG